MIEAKRREDRRKKLIEDGLKCFAGLATGLASVGAACVLFAPKSGDETREDIKNFYNEKKDQAEEIARNAREKVQDKAQGIYDKGKKALDNAKDKACLLYTSLGERSFGVIIESAIVSGKIRI